PRELGVVVMFYNRTLFRKAGLPDPPPDWTHEDFLRMARKLTIYEDGSSAVGARLVPPGTGSRAAQGAPLRRGGGHGRIIQYGFFAGYTWCGVYAPWV